MISLCSGWEFAWSDSEAFRRFETEAESIRLPHTVKEVPLNYASPNDYETVCGYRRKLSVDKAWEGKRLFLQFDGAAHIATVFVNGKELFTHRCGYTAFRVEITEAVRFGEENDIAVRLDCTENASIPPFGFVIDYLTYGGLYREAWLDVREREYIEDVFVIGDDRKHASVTITVDGKYESASVRILDGDKVLAEATGKGTVEFDVPAAELWDLEHPNCYSCEVSLPNGDRKAVTFGFRSAVFTENAFLLNGKETFLRGLNRHQCYPYLGYAAPERLQRDDARILKDELQCTAVRTSHYPQSQYFIDECDRLGLLVFTEIPGWQHIGDAKWKDQAVENTREMVLQYRNHPSIILWGVRINESQDDNVFYTRTNALTHELDPSRATSGVRYLEKSSLLEDVYAFNDFSHIGTNPGAKAKKDVTSDTKKALLISEHSGHMFPTKAFDGVERRQEHALRHARVLERAHGDGGHVGCFGWCMFDYPTHKDFGSGNRVCYHGVMDAFRNPKLAASVYASQGEGRDVLEVGSTMDIGDYPGGQTGEIYVFTNADSVKLYKNDNFVIEMKPTGWDGLWHAPLSVDDKIGELLKTQEGFTGQKEKLLHESLLSAEKYGMANMPLQDKLKMGYAMVRYGLKYADGYALYGKYVGNWGGEATVWRFDAIKNGKVVKSVTRAPSAKVHLELTADTTVLHEGDRYDMAAVRVRVVNEHGTLAHYDQCALSFRTEGALKLCGPTLAAAEGGMGGCYVRTVGQSGEGKLIVSAPGKEDAVINFTITKEKL